MRAVAFSLCTNTSTENPNRMRASLRPFTLPPEMNTAPDSLMNERTPYFTGAPSLIHPHGMEPTRSNCLQAPNTISSYASTAQWVPELTIPSSTEHATSSPQSYTLIQGAASSLYNTDYTPTSTSASTLYAADYTSTSTFPLTQPEDLGLSLTPWRSTTPFSQASEDSFTTFPHASTTSNPEGLDIGSAWRSHTPFSQASEDSLLDGLLDP